MVTNLFQMVLALHGWPVYAVVFALAFLEAAAFLGLVLPDTALLVAGVLASRGNIDLRVLLVLAIVAAIGGDSVGYLVGRHFGPRLRLTRLGARIKARHWDRAEQAVAVHGFWAVVTGRWVGVLRALVPTVAGMIAMPYRRFLAANALGGTAWVGAVVLLGYSAGISLAHIQGLLRMISLAMVTALAFVIVVAVVRARRRKGADAAHAGDVKQDFEVSASAPTARSAPATALPTLL
jgi:membrane protein DedA with SNARE-associated domain